MPPARGNSHQKKVEMVTVIDTREEEPATVPSPHDHDEQPEYGELRAGDTADQVPDDGVHVGSLLRRLPRPDHANAPRTASAVLSSGSPSSIT